MMESPRNQLSASISDLPQSSLGMLVNGEKKTTLLLIVPTAFRGGISLLLDLQMDYQGYQLYR